VRAVRERAGVTAELGDSLGSVRHLFTHRDLRLEVVALTRESGSPPRARRAEARFCGAAELAGLPLSKLTKKALALGRPM
jgi:adenine-specific DNA glycosylase